jgi:hypothetical protein
MCAFVEILADQVLEKTECQNSAKVDQIDQNLPARPSMKAPIAGVDVPWSVS